jgi:hypothetical protein
MGGKQNVSKVNIEKNFFEVFFCLEHFEQFSENFTERQLGCHWRGHTYLLERIFVSGANPATSKFTTTTRTRAFFKLKETIFVFQTHKATRGVVTDDHRNGS